MTLWHKSVIVKKFITATMRYGKLFSTTRIDHKHIKPMRTIK